MPVDWFTIDANTGEVTVAGNLDYETATEPYHYGACDIFGWLKLHGRYGDQRRPMSRMVTRTMPLVRSPTVIPSANQVSENANVGDSVGVTALATDADGDTVTYSLDDDAGGLFTIDANTGEVTVAGNLDYETATSHTITVRATSTDGSSSTADMAINVV